MGLVFTLDDSRGPSSTPTELISLVASQHCQRQTAKQVEVATTKSRKKERSILSPVTGLKKRPYCPKPAQPPHIATGESCMIVSSPCMPRAVLSQHTDINPSDYSHPTALLLHTGRWSTAEHALFLKGLAAYGKEWKKVSKMVSRFSLSLSRSLSSFLSTLFIFADVISAFFFFDWY